MALRAVLQNLSAALVYTEESNIGKIDFLCIRSHGLLCVQKQTASFGTGWPSLISYHKILIIRYAQNYYEPPRSSESEHLSEGRFDSLYVQLYLG